MEKINIKVDENNTIANIDELINIINNFSNTKENKDYLESLINNIKYTNLVNKDFLVETISNKLLEMENLDKEMENEEALRVLQDYNEDLKKISVHKTSKEKNDSKRDIEYISIKHDDGTVDMLVCAGANSLGNFINSNKKDIVSKDAETIFHILKENYHKELEFYKESDMNTRGANLDNKAINQNTEMKALEMKTLKEYAKKYGLDDKVDISVDSNGERIYRMDDGVFKFYTNNENKRTLEVLVKPSIKKLDEEKTQNEDIDSLMDELDEEEDRSFDMIDPDTFVIDPNFDIDLDKLKDLIIRKNIYEEILKVEEYNYINICILYLINILEDEIKNNNGVLTDRIEVLYDYMEPYVDVLKEIENGRLNANMLSENEKKTITLFINKKEKVKGLLKNNNKKLEYIFNDNGLANIVILLLIAIVGILILCFVSIDI